MDYIFCISNSWISDFENKVKWIVLKNYENIIIYGLGQSGISSYEKLKDTKNIFIWDDCEKKRKELEKTLAPLQRLWIYQT